MRFPLNFEFLGVLDLSCDCVRLSGCLVSYQSWAKMSKVCERKGGWVLSGVKSIKAGVRDALWVGRGLTSHLSSAFQEKEKGLWGIKMWNPDGTFGNFLLYTLPPSPPTNPTKLFPGLLQPTGSFVCIVCSVCTSQEINKNCNTPDFTN